MKIVTIVGARPQFVKAGIVSKAFIAIRPDIKEYIVHTGQHFDNNMSQIFFDEMGIPQPKYNLNIGGGTHGQNTGRMIEAIEQILMKVKPSWVIVYGDTDSTLAGTIAAAKLHIPIAHVEAGLRSFNRKMPEEINRVLTDHTSSILFTPTITANLNLQNEGITESKIRFVGDVMYDATLFYKRKAKPVPGIDLSKRLLLSTIHRAENTDDLLKLKGIIKALNQLSDCNNQVVLPLHPRTKAILNREKIDVSKIKVISPVGYLEMLWLLDKCSFVITDSGGLQKEAFFFKKPCITTRNETEWVELIDAGFNKLVGSNTDLIIKSFSEVQSPINYPNLYGNGKASIEIVNHF